MHSSHRADSAVDAIELLKQDHKAVQMLFADFTALRDSAVADPARKHRLVQRICLELTVHAQLEEELFYPALRQALDDERVDEAEEEHAEAKELIVALQQMPAQDPQLDSTMLALARAVLHHVQEEERELFTESRGELDAAALGQQLMQRRTALHEQLNTDPSFQSQGEPT